MLAQLAAMMRSPVRLNLAEMDALLGAGDRRDRQAAMRRVERARDRKLRAMARGLH